MAQRRRIARYEIRAPVNFKWEDHSGVSQQNEGVTRDISVRGVYIASPVVPPAGTELSVAILFPPLDGPGKGTVWGADGKVARVSSAVEENGFAVVSESGLHHPKQGHDDLV